MNRFKQYLNERLDLNDEIVFRSGQIKIRQSNHSVQRIAQRNQLSEKELSTLFDRVCEKMEQMRFFDKDPRVRLTLLFYSRSLKQGIVTGWNGTNNILTIITFLDKSDKLPWKKPGDEYVILEGKEYQVIYV